MENKNQGTISQIHPNLYQKIYWLFSYNFATKSKKDPFCEFTNTIKLFNLIIFACICVQKLFYFTNLRFHFAH